MDSEGLTSVAEPKENKEEEMESKGLSRREFLAGAALAGAGVAAAACGTPAPTAAPTTPPSEEPTAAPTAKPTAAPTIGPTKDKIVVGMARPLSGPLAIIGDSAFRPVYETWVPRVNADGGVYVEEYGGKLPIELIIYDDTSDVGTMTRLTEKLILEDKVDFLWPASGTSFVFAQSPIANKYEYVLVTAEGGATQIKDMLPSLPYVFVTLSFSDWYQLPVFADIMSAAGAKTAYISYIADLHGIEYSGVAGIEFPKKGIEVVGLKSLPPDIKDLSPVLKDADATGADIFCCFAYPDQVMPATGTAIELGYNPKAIIGGPGVNFGFYHTTFGPMAEGVCGFTCFARGMTPELDELADILYEGKPEETNDWWGHPFYWAGLDMWKAAIEAAGTLDQKAVRDVLANEHLQTVLGETWFDNGLLALEAHKGEIGQWINGVYESVGPEPWTTADLVYPKPAWGA
ncbi:MAG: amino acid ABC transporter substrate-binding protein [Anaerolineae bacterium]|nr:amino acid ABC transporter substrate-binding protein [Anaerolineae bacterium]